MKPIIRTWEAALQEWQQGSIENIPPHFITALIKQLQDEQIRRRIELAIIDRENDIDMALGYCAENNLTVWSCEEAVGIWHDSDEYATEQEERKGCDDSHEDRDRD